MCEDAADEQVFVVTLRRPGFAGGYTFPADELHLVVQGEMEGASAGDKLTVEWHYMSRKAMDALPDFEGW